MPEKRPFSQDIYTVSREDGFESLGSAAEVDTTSRTIHIRVAERPHREKISVAVGNRGLRGLVVPPRR